MLADDAVAALFGLEMDAPVAAIQRVERGETKKARRRPKDIAAERGGAAKKERASGARAAKWVGARGRKLVRRPTLCRCRSGAHFSDAAKTTASASRSTMWLQLHRLSRWGPERRAASVSAGERSRRLSATVNSLALCGLISGDADDFVFDRGPFHRRLSGDPVERVSPERIETGATPGSARRQLDC